MPAHIRNLFPAKTRAAVLSAVAFLLLYHITRPFWLPCDYSSFIDMSIKFCIDLIVLLITIKGAKQNRKKRNQYLLLIMIFYFTGDMITSFSPIPAAVPYAIGHILLIYCVTNTCSIKKWQYIFLSVFAIASVPIILLVGRMIPDLPPVLYLIAFIYGLILIAKFCLSLTNRFFRYAAILFLIGDAVGFLRITVLTELTPIIDYTAYVAAILLYGLSTYNCSRKDAVCFGDVTALCRALSKKGIRFFIYGEWSGNLFFHRFLRQSAQLEIMYSADQQELICAALEALHYQTESSLSAQNKTLYSEKLGTLHIKDITLLPDSSIVYCNKNGNQYILDSGCIHTLHRVKTEYPCIFPTDENDQVLDFFREE